MKAVIESGMLQAGRRKHVRLFYGTKSKGVWCDIPSLLSLSTLWHNQRVHFHRPFCPLTQNRQHSRSLSQHGSQLGSV